MSSLVTYGGGVACNFFEHNTYVFFSRDWTKKKRIENDIARVKLIVFRLYLKKKKDNNIVVIIIIYRPHRVVLLNNNVFASAKAMDYSSYYYIFFFH